MNSGTQFYPNPGPHQWNRGPQSFGHINVSAVPNGPPNNGYPAYGGYQNGYQNVQQQRNRFYNQDQGNNFNSGNPKQNGYRPHNNYNKNVSNGYHHNHINSNFSSNIVDGNDWSEKNGKESLEKKLFHVPNSGINFDNYDSIPVNVSGEGAPVPIEMFEDANLHELVQANVDKSGYSKPTPVQKHSIPTLLGNLDLMSCAQTGSGKTAAFLLPIINHILSKGPEVLKPPTSKGNGRSCYYPYALVLSPTRELAIQIHKEATKFSFRTSIVTSILYGGRENYREQIARLKNGCHILIATPGRLIDILEQGYVGLSACRYLVLDEADRMLDMGFEPQIRKIVQQGQMPDKSDRITAMFSATFPKAIQELAQDFLRENYVFLAVGRVGSTSDNIDQHLEWIEEHDKKKALMTILDQEEGSNLVLVFVETKRGANELSYYLQKTGIGAVAIHGDLKQFDRERNLAMFSSGQTTVLVATAVAARGLDIPNVKHVVNYDLPGDIDEYVHRIGRTGRCGNTGRATSFFNEKNRSLGRDLAQLIVEANKEVPDWLQKVASEGKPLGRGNRGRFGGTDHRRGPGRNNFNNQTYHAQNGYNGQHSYNGYSGPHPNQHRTYVQRNFNNVQSGFQNHPNNYVNYTRGDGFGSSGGGFGGGMMTTNFYPQAPNTFAQMGPNFQNSPMPQNMRQFGQWQPNNLN
ncbi:unnamed protein product [Auanema sp. JU1783]|nr:unnamed protein product [Auanema sp. JU1783]